MTEPISIFNAKANHNCSTLTKFCFLGSAGIFQRRIGEIWSGNHHILFLYKDRSILSGIVLSSDTGIDKVVSLNSERTKAEAELSELLGNGYKSCRNQVIR